MAQLVEHHLAKVRVAGSNPVVRSEGTVCPCGMPFAAEWPSGLGKGLQSPVHGFDSRLRLSQSQESPAEQARRREGGSSSRSLWAGKPATIPGTPSGTVSPGAARDHPAGRTAPRKPATPRGPRQPPGDETALYLGVSIGNLINLFNPERIIIGGWAGMLLGERLLPAIRAAAREHSLHHPFGQTSIELGRLGPDAVALGAATLPVEALLSGTRSAATKSDRPAS